MSGSEEFFETLVGGGGCRVERIVSRGHSSPPEFWYDQPENEWVMVVRGRARLRLADPDESLELMPGDWIDIPAHRRHRVEWTDPDRETVWLAVYYGEAESR